MDIINDSFINDINLAICIFPADTLHNEELSDRMIDFTKFYANRINEISDNLITILVEDSIDEALEKHNQYFDHILFMAAGVRIYDASIIFDIKEEILNTPNYMAASHILEWKENWYELHHQFVLVNSKNWIKAGAPKYGRWENQHDDLVVIERSVENFHDDYTPLWIKNTGKIENRFHSKQGWNFINESLKNGFDIINWSQKIRNKRTYYYPESNTERFLECLKTQTIDATLNVNQVKLLQTPMSIKNQIWLLNSENMSLTINNKNLKFDTIAIPAGGFKFLDSFYSNYLNEGGKLIIYDFNNICLDWIRYIIQSNVRDIKELVVNYPNRNFFHYLGRGGYNFNPSQPFDKSFLDSLQRTYDYFGGEENFNLLIDKLRTSNVELVNVDLIQAPNILLEKMVGKLKYISISNIFCTDYTNAFIGLKNIKKHYDDFFKKITGNTVVVGFDTECKYVDKLIEIKLI